MHYLSVTWGKVIHICNNKYRQKRNVNIFYKRAFSTYVNKSATDIAITIWISLHIYNYPRETLYS